MLHNRRLSNRLAGLLVTVIAAAGAAAPALSHPHVWITARTEVIFDDQARVSALRVTWHFDEFYSLFAIEGLDRNGDGQLDPAELKPLAELNVTSLRDYSYFTYVTAAGSTVEFGPARNYESKYQDGILSLEFVVPLARPVDPVAEQLRFVSYDPTFYIAVEPRLEEPVTLAGAPKTCRAVETRSPESASLQLSEADFLDPAASQEIGRLYATEFAIACAPAGGAQ